MRARVKPDRDETVPVVRAAAPPQAVVVDWDGTITERDMLDDVARRFGDPAVYSEVEEGLLAGRISLRECIEREYQPVRAPLGEVVEHVLANTRLRPGVPELLELARERGWRLVVLSSGFRELIDPVLAREGLDAEVLANAVEPRPDGWRVRWRDESRCAVCGQSCKRGSLPQEAHLVYVGDGYSDRCAALAADRVFARRSLARHLSEEGVPYEPFEDFFDVVAALGGPA